MQMHTAALSGSLEYNTNDAESGSRWNRTFLADSGKKFRIRPFIDRLNYVLGFNNCQVTFFGGLFYLNPDSNVSKSQI